MASTYTLHYGGQKFNLPESQKGVLDEWEGGEGIIKLNLDNGTWLTIVVGPGIPIALVESEGEVAHVYT